MHSLECPQPLNRIFLWWGIEHPRLCACRYFSSCPKASWNQRLFVPQGQGRSMCLSRDESHHQSSSFKTFKTVRFLAYWSILNSEKKKALFSTLFPFLVRASVNKSLQTKFKYYCSQISRMHILWRCSSTLLLISGGHIYYTPREVALSLIVPQWHW